MSGPKAHGPSSSGEACYDWNKNLQITNEEIQPSELFHHVCKSELNGIDLDSIVEVENEDKNGYWFAIVCSSNGVLIKLHYLGDKTNKLDFWIELSSLRLHSLNWGREHNIKLVPPYSDKFMHADPNIIIKIAQNYEYVPNSILRMNGAPIFTIFKPNMFVEIQDEEYPYHVWISKIVKNVGGRLLLKIQGESSPKKKPFWLFYLNTRVFPLGWAEKYGLPWRVLNSEFVPENADSSILSNVLKPMIPENHSFKVGEMLEVLDPHSLTYFYVATIVKVYNKQYFKVEINSENNVISFIATKESPYLFNAGWAIKHKFILKPPSDWNSSKIFCWSKYASMKKCRLASVENTPRTKIDLVRIGMKLEAVDPIEPDHILVSSVKGFSESWIFLSFDCANSDCCQNLYVRSVYSDEIFPAGWCSKHEYPLSAPNHLQVDGKMVVNKNNNFLEFAQNRVNMNLHFAQSSKIQMSSTYISESLPKENNYYLNHTELFPSNSFLKNILFDNQFYIYFNKTCYSGHMVKKRIPTLPSSIGPGPVSKMLQKAITLFVNLDIIPQIALVKILKIQKLIEYDGVFKLITTDKSQNYPSLSLIIYLPESKSMAKVYCVAICKFFGICENFMTIEQNAITCNCAIKQLEHFNTAATVNNEKCVFQPKVYDQKNCFNNDLKHIVNTTNLEKINSSLALKVYGNNNEIYIYLNKDCYPGNRLIKEKICSLPTYIGPGPASKILQVAITLFIHIVYYPKSSLQEILRIQKKLMDGTSGSNSLITISETSSQPSFSLHVCLPECKKMSEMYCFTFCKLFGTCEHFMSTEKIPFPCKCYTKEIDDLKLKLPVNHPSVIMNDTEQKVKSKTFNSFNYSEQKIDTNYRKKTRVDNRVLHFSAKSLIEKLKYYSLHKLNYDVCITSLKKEFSPLILASTSELQYFRASLLLKNNADIFKTLPDQIKNCKPINFIENWKTTFENYYHNNLNYHSQLLDIGDFKEIPVLSNPKLWTIEDVYEYLSTDVHCEEIRIKLLKEELDGVAFMFLNEDLLINKLHCGINLAMRLMCHVSEVIFVFITKYCYKIFT